MERSQERLQVLRMIESGKVSAEEGLRLLEAVERGDAGEDASEQARWLRIRVEEGGRQKVNVNLPLDLVEMLVRFVPRELLDKAEGVPVEPKEIVRLIRAGVRGRIVEVEDDDKSVQIFVE